MRNDASDRERASVLELAGSVLQAARQNKVTLGCAESCTGGLIAASLTSIPGSSDTFVGGIVSYWAEVKQAVLGVSDEIIRTYGVVSSECAAAMAEGACKALSCDYAVATTGIAGPTGAEPGKPVGTVWYGLATPAGTYTFKTCRGSSRDEVRLMATRSALEALLDELGHIPS